MWWEVGGAKCSVFPPVSMMVGVAGREYTAPYYYITLTSREKMAI